MQRQVVELFHVPNRPGPGDMAPLDKNSSLDLHGEFKFRPKIIDPPFPSWIETCLTLRLWKASDLPYRFDIRNEHGFPYTP